MTNTSVLVISSDSLILTLNLIQINMGRYLYSIIFVVGNVGSFLNILILTQRVYLRNSCSCYVLASSIANLFVINIIILYHILTLGFSIDPTASSLFFCRFRQYISSVPAMVSRIYIVLACIDRWATTSATVRRRAFSQMKVARRLIPSVGIGWCIISLHIPVNYYIVNGRCTIVSSIYLVFYSIYNTVLSGLLIPILMIIFGFLTIRNVKCSRQRIDAQININRILVNQRVRAVDPRSREYEILIMILVQLGVYIITCLPQTVYLVYLTVTSQWTKSNGQLALDKFYSTIANALSNINFTATFYIYVLTTRVFRKDLKRILVGNRLFKCCFGTRQNPGTIGTVAIVINRRMTALM